MKSAIAKTSYLSLPHIGEAPDLLSNPRLSKLVIRIDSRLLLPFYNDIELNNKRLTFFQTGDEYDHNRSFYLRSFLPFRPTPELKFSEAELDDPLPWEPLAKLLVGVFKPIGCDLSDFYTTIHPAVVGRHNAHRDKLQDESWKVDVRFSSIDTELLVLDHADRRWYALRFPMGGSGYVIDSALFSLFHAVRAGPKIQQSILAVFGKQGSDIQIMRESIAQATHRASGSQTAVTVNHKDFELPSTTGNNRSQVSRFIHARHVANYRRCAELLRNAVVEVDPCQALKAQAQAFSKDSGWLSQVPLAVVDRAVAKLPREVRSQVRKAYENNIKLPQLAAYGVPKHSHASKRGNITVGEARRTIVDYRLVCIHGNSNLGGECFYLPDYTGPATGSEDILFRLVWSTGDLYYLDASITAVKGNVNALALLAVKLGFRLPRIIFSVDCDDTISGKAAAALRENGFDLRVVHVAGELDNATKRLRELERRRLLKPLADGIPLQPQVKRGRIKGGETKRTIIDYRLVSIHGTATLNGKSFHLLEYTGPGTEDRLFRFPWSNGDQYHVYVNPNSEKNNVNTLALLAAILGFTSPKIKFNIDGQDIITGKAATALRDNGFNLRVVRVAGEPDNATKRRREIERHQSLKNVQVPQVPLRPRRSTGVKRPLSAWNFYLQDNLKSAKGNVALLKNSFEALSVQDKKAYDDKAEIDRRRFDKEKLERSSKATCFEIFCSEMSPILARQASDKYTGEQGEANLKRDLKAKWMRLDRSAWWEYERKAQSVDNSLG